MFRKNLTSQYKVYTNNLQSLKNKILTGNNVELGAALKQSIKCNGVSSRVFRFSQLSKEKIIDTSQEKVQRIAAEIQNNLKEKFSTCCSVFNKKLTDGKSDKHYPLHTKIIEDLKHKSLDNVQKKLGSIRKATNQHLKKRGYVLGALIVTDVELLSKTSETNLTATVSPVAEVIPEPPPIPDPSTFADAVSQVNALGEPTFVSLGLGGWTPVGIVQSCLEYLHVTLGIPWWEAIVIGTIVVRFLMFPLVVIAQRNAARMNNYLPQLQAIQLKMTDARQTGNQLDAARYSQEMMLFMKEKNLNPLKNMIVPLAQMPLFISFFVGLRKMANLPVDSLRDGGMWWFTDLTVPDQYFLLPVVTSLTLWATIELGTDSAKLSSQNLQTMRYVLRALPLIILPFTVNFPGAILCYWVASNFISLAQVGFLRVPTVRDYFKIEPLIKHEAQNLPIRSKGFVGGVKDSWTNIKITRELEERRRYDEMQFQRAGKGPLVKTYKYDPTKQVKDNPNAINAKNR